jgi:hypothetical protein
MRGGASPRGPYPSKTDSRYDSDAIRAAIAADLAAPRSARARMGTIPACRLISRTRYPTSAFAGRARHAGLALWRRRSGPAQPTRTPESGRRHASGLPARDGRVRRQCTSATVPGGPTKRQQWIAVVAGVPAMIASRLKQPLRSRDRFAPIGAHLDRGADVAARWQMRKSPARRWRPSRPWCSHAFAQARRLARSD